MDIKTTHITYNAKNILDTHKDNQIANLYMRNKSMLCSSDTSG